MVADARLEIANEKELEAIIKKEKEEITSDPALKKTFSDLEKHLSKNATVREFQYYIEQNQELLPSLANIEEFREEVWKSYIHENIDLYNDLIKNYKDVEQRKINIEHQAEKERTQWEEVIEIFNDRFFVPFRLEAKNRIQVMLGADPILSFGFTFLDGSDSATVERDDLIAALSTGEKKALYILNIIFEIQVRRETGEKTVIIVDDIADSFDYKNKFAIIQYLSDIMENENFYLIILTHNFDFFRAAHSRLTIGYPYCLMATKSSTGLKLNQAAGIRNIFVNDWKANFFSDSKKRVASIPFIRNLIEFTKGEQDPDYIKLTSLLHWKNDTESILQDDLSRIYQAVFGTADVIPDSCKSVWQLIQDSSNECLTAAEGINFEHKIVLSIAIRLFAERFMIAKISDNEFVENIRYNQTPKLLGRLKKNGDQKPETIKILDKVVLMTPENIHLNSFMYEPILDMSDEHLRKLYEEVVALT